MADFVAAPGVKKFVSLEDTPASFSGQADKYTKVGTLEEALEFATVEAGIAEGDYTSWTHKWTNDIPDGLRPDWYCGRGLYDQLQLLNRAAWIEI